MLQRGVLVGFVHPAVDAKNFLADGCESCLRLRPV